RGALYPRFEVASALFLRRAERLLEIPDVGPRHEMLTRSGEHDAAHRRIPLEALQELADGHEHLVIDRVAHLGTVERNACHRPVDARQYLLAHRGFTDRTRCWARYPRSCAIPQPSPKSS